MLMLPSFVFAQSDNNRRKYRKSCPVCTAGTQKVFENTLWFWGGVAVIYFVGDLDKYVKAPIMAYQGGVGKGLYVNENHGLFYFHTQITFASAKKNIGIDKFTAHSFRLV